MCYSRKCYRIRKFNFTIKKNEDIIQYEYNQLCLIYPNNPYVASAYAGFLNDIAYNEKEGAEYVNIYKQLRAGFHARVERSYFFAVKQYPSIPSEEQHIAFSQPAVQHGMNFGSSQASSVSSVAAFQQNDFVEQSDEKAQKRSVDLMIESVRLPTMRIGPFLLTLVFCIMMGIIFITLLVSIVNRIHSNKDAITISKLSSKLILSAEFTLYFSYQYVLSQNNFIEPLNTLWNQVFPRTIFHNSNNNNNDLKFSDNITTFLSIGGELSDKQLLFWSIDQTRDYMAQLTDNILKLATSNYFTEPLLYLYGNGFESKVFYDVSNSIFSNVSISRLISQMINQAIQISQKTPSDALEFADFWMAIKNSYNLNKIGRELTLSI